MLTEKWSMTDGDAHFTIRLPDSTRVNCALPANTAAKVGTLAFWGYMWTVLKLIFIF